jgi:hypothetical protein
MYSSVNSHFNQKKSDEKKKKNDKIDKNQENNGNFIYDQNNDENIERKIDGYNGIKNYISSSKIDILNKHIKLKKKNEYLLENKSKNSSNNNDNDHNDTGKSKNQDIAIYRGAIIVDGINYLPSNMSGFYNREKKIQKNKKIENEYNDKCIDFQIVLSEADLMILEKRKSAQNRVLHHNEFISPIKFQSKGTD